MKKKTYYFNPVRILFLLGVLLILVGMILGVDYDELTIIAFRNNTNSFTYD